jgi:hypothetical protein
VVAGALADYLISTYYLHPRQQEQEQRTGSSASEPGVGEHQRDEWKRKVPSVPPPPEWWPSWWPAGGWGWFAWMWEEPDEGTWEEGV